MSAVFITVAIASIGTSVAPHISQEAFFAALSHDVPRRELPQIIFGQIETPPTEKTEETENTDDGYEIVPVNISQADGSGNILYKNETKYTFDTAALLGGEYPVDKISDDKVSVLVVHTHATECYAKEDEKTVSATRSDDPGQNMLAVGKVIVDTLAENGVGAVQCTTMHDKDSYNKAYTLSEKSVSRYLEEYPDIKYILDVHRDAIALSDNAMAKPVTEGDGRSLAQLMLVVGTNEAGADHPEWKKNLTVATRLQKNLIEYNEELVRPINIRSASFNEQYSPGFLLLEVGSCANTLSEAKASAEIFARVFADMIKNGG